MTEFYKQITQQLSQEINNKINIIQTNVKALQNEMNDFVNYIQEKSLDMTTTGTYEEQVKSYETIVDRIQKIIEQKVELNKKKEIILKNMNEIFLSDILKDNKNEIEDYHDKVVFKLLESKSNNHKIKMNEINKVNEKELEQLENEYQRKREEMKKKQLEQVKEITEIYEKLENESEKQLLKQISKNERRNYSLMLEENEIKKIEEWTEKKCSDVLFDSEKHNWSQNTSIFDDKIVGKSHFAIVIEDEEKNKFGYYTPKKIEQVGKYYNDQNAFLFSLKSNGRLNGMMKFESLKMNDGFIVRSKSDSTLFGIYSGFYLHKENDKNNSNCYENASDKYYDLRDQQYPLIGKPKSSKFTPKRITVIQMK